MSKVCRLCVDESSNFIEMFSKIGRELDIISIISSHFWFQPTENDLYSNIICTKCWKRLNDFDEFYKDVKKAQDKMLPIHNDLANDATNHIACNVKEEGIPIIKHEMTADYDSINSPVFDETDDVKEQDYSDPSVSDTEQNHPTTRSKNRPVKNEIAVAVEHKQKRKRGRPCTKNKKTVIVKRLKRGRAKIKNEEFDEPDKAEENDKPDESDKSDDADKFDDTDMLDDFDDKTDNADEDYDIEETDKCKSGRSNEKMEKRGRPKGSITKSREERFEMKKQTEDKRNKEKFRREEEDKKIRDFFKLECEICSVKLTNFTEINIHYRQVHSLKRGHVTCCNKKLLRRCAILEHLDWHFNPDEFRCSLCGKVYSDRYCLRLHMAHHAPEEMRTFKCDICGKGYSTKGKLSHHLSITHVTDEEKMHKCKDCGKAFPLYSILTSHVRRVHEFAYTSVCDICAKVFKSKNQCDIHRREQHSEEKKQKVECNLCGAWLKNRVSLYCHMRRSHARTPHPCDICGKISPNKEALRNHKRYVHEMKRLFKCSFCDKAFKQLVGLKEHQASHTGDILYVCPYCPKTFNSNANMHAHRKNKHPEEWLRDRNDRMGPIKDL